MLIDVETYQDKKTALVDVEKPQEGKVHRSVPTNGEEIVAYEEIPENYPSWAIIVFDDAQEYLREIRNVDWIMEEITDEELEGVKEETKAKELIKNGRR